MSDELKLMSADYRIVHFLAIFSIGALLLTGSSEHGIGLLAFHIDFGILCGLVLAFYCIMIAARHRIRLFDALRNPLGFQIKEAFAVIGKYVLGTPYPADVKSRMARYNILASYASLVLALSFIPLTIGGVAMVFLEKGTLLYEQMKILHVFGVGLIALFFLVHVFAVLNSENRPLLKAMFANGRVPREWAREHLADYLRKTSPEN